MIKEALNKIITGYELDNTALEEVFDEIFSGLADPIIASSFITALKINDFDISLYLSAIKSSKNAVKKIDIDCIDKENCIENINISFPENIIDISFAMDIICAANDLCALKYGFDSAFCVNKSFNTLEAFDVKLDNKNEIFINNIEVLNFGYFKIASDSPYYKYSFDLSRKLPFINIFNILDYMLNPYGVKNQFIGVNSKNNVEKFANLSLGLNNSNTVVVSSKNNFSFISPDDETYISEAWKNKVFSYTLSPELLGFKPHSIDEIKSENAQNCADIILNVFKNKLKGAAYDVIIMNSALALYIAKKADSILDGLELAKKTIDSGNALYKLEQIINILKNDSIE